MRAVMYGAGNIGRGFIGALFSQAGYEVSFIDVAPETVRRLNEKGCYPVRIVSDEEFEDISVTNVSAIDGNDKEAVAEAIANCDIMATAVGANVLKFIAPNIAAGIARRDRALDIIICENLMDADKLLAGLLREHLPEDVLNERVGLVEASIGRMVPVQTQEMKDGEPLRVCVEEYGFLPVDRDAFKGEIPDIPNLVPYSPFGFYLRRKLYVHNMGHAVCAYLGLYTGREYIHSAMDDADIHLIVKNAMLESIAALAREYGASAAELQFHVNDLLLRFENKALGDTCARVGADVRRKLAANDRLIGAAKLCLKHGIAPVHIALGAAAALQNEGGEPAGLLYEYSGLEPESELSRLILSFCAMLDERATPAQLRKAARKHLLSKKQKII